MYKKIIINPFLILLSFLLISNVYAESVFKKYKIDQNITISIPKNWSIYGKFEKDFLNQYIEAVSDDIEEINYADLKGDINLLKAVSKSPSYATISVDVSKLEDIKTLSKKDLRTMDNQLKKVLIKMLPAQGFKLKNYGNSYMHKIAKFPALTTVYDRSGLKGDVKVFIHQIQTERRIIKIMKSYRVSEEKFWNPVFKKIFNSLQIND